MDSEDKLVYDFHVESNILTYTVFEAIPHELFTNLINQFTDLVKHALYIHLIRESISLPPQPLKGKLDLLFDLLVGR